MSIKQFLYTCIFGVFISSFIFLSPLPLQAEEINNYSVDIKINKDSSINVSESIEYDFEESSRHGIFRTIPLDAWSGLLDKKIEISDIKVTDNKGNERPFKILSSLKKKKIKIGDPDKKISGIQTYNISYKVDWVLRYLAEKDELYWNAIGSGWDVPIRKAEVIVRTPKKMERSKLTLNCFVGKSGSKESCENTYFVGKNGKVTQITFKHNSTISGSEAFTIITAFPKEIVQEPSQAQLALKLVSDNWTLALPILTIIVMLFVWYKWGRDRAGRDNVIAQYEPPEGLTPIEIGMLVDEKIGNHDISAQIIYLATQGYLDIGYEKEEGILFDDKKYILKKKKDLKKAEPGFNKKLLGMLFSSKDEVGLSEVNSNKIKLGRIKKDISKKLTDSGYYRFNPNKMRGIFILIAVLLAFGSFIILSWYPEAYQTFISAFVSSFIIGIFGYFMTPKSKQGTILEEKILGFKEYLSVAEKERLEFHNAPEKNPETFEKFLPYAIAFEVEDQWAQEFDDMYDKKPKWYHGPAKTYSATSLADDMSSFDSAVNESPIGQTSGSGSTAGSAGGGAGGGGGGSW
ncbi:MAG: DUF2207 domain-containing protein [Candidatus Magasanikbacteria bacterium]